MVLQLKIIQVKIHNQGILDNDNNMKYTVTQSGRISNPYDQVAKFLETAHMQDSVIEGKWIKLFYYNSEEMVNKLRIGIFYQESYSLEEILEKTI